MARSSYSPDATLPFEAKNSRGVQKLFRRFGFYILVCMVPTFEMAINIGITTRSRYVSSGPSDSINSPRIGEVAGNAAPMVSTFGVNMAAFLQIFTPFETFLMYF